MPPGIRQPGHVTDYYTSLGRLYSSPAATLCMAQLRQRPAIPIRANASKGLYLFEKELGMIEQSETHPTIVVVDDERGVVAVLRRLLSDFGNNYDVITANSAA